MQSVNQTLSTFFRKEGRLVLWFVSTVMGIWAKLFFDASVAKKVSVPSWPEVVFSTIVAMLCFPTIYQHISTMEQAPVFLQVSIAFQNGFFWQSIVQSLF